MGGDSSSSSSTRGYESYNSEIEVEVDVSEKTSLVLKKTDYKKLPITADPNEVLMKPIEFLMILLGSLGAIGMGCTPLAFYYFFGQLIKTTATETLPEQENSIQDTSYLFFLIAGVAGICGLLQNFCFIYAGERFAARIRKELFKAINRQEIAYFDTTTTGELVAKLSEECQQIRDAFSDKTGQIFTSFAQFVCGISFAFYYSWQLTLVMMGVAPFMGVVIAGQGFFLIKYTKMTATASQDAMGVANEVISNFRTVRSFSTEEKEVGRFDNKLINLVDTARKRATAQGIGMGLIQVMVWGACGVAFWFGGFLVGSGDLNFGDLVTVFGMMLFACLGLSLGFAAVPELLKGRASYNRIKGLIHRVPEIPFAGGNTLASVEGNVEFENVKFRYKSREIDVLHGISFQVKQGKTVAFVGESGSGKSTIFSLIERFYEATAGRVLIDRHDIRDLDPRWLHKHIAIVSQEPVLFATTIAENISYTRDGASLSDIMSAAKAANAHDFIVALPDGYNTLVGERGVQLSGGQKQRVAIARAILANPKILLLDEATSALDTESEQLVQDALDRLMHNRTSLCIAHRLATVRNADTIFVLMKGQIVARGTHEELLENSEDYANLARRQLSLHN